MEDIITEEAIFSNTKFLDRISEELVGKKYVTNPAIERDEEIKKMLLILLTPDKSAVLVGKAGIGKTAIVEGLAYKIQNNDVPDVLKGYKVYKINSSSLLGKALVDGREEANMTSFINEVKKLEKTIIFIDEIHTLIGSNEDGPMDLANVLKPALDRGDIKVIGATTTQEYNQYVIRDRAFLRRFDKVEVLEPDFDTTVKILLGSLPRIEEKTGIKVKYSDYIKQQVMESIVDATSEYKRIYGLAAMYPDVSFSVLSQAFSNALFNNKSEVDIVDFYEAIRNSKRIYPKTIIKELDKFKEKFHILSIEEKKTFPNVTIDELEEPEVF